MRLFKSEFKSIKCVVALFLTCSICLSAYLTIQTLLSYLSYEVITTSRTLLESPAVFPKITFCNLNAFTSEYSVEFLKRINKKFEPLLDIYNENQMKNLNYDEKNRLASNISLQARIEMNSGNMNDTEKRKLSRNLSEILLLCKFNQEKCTSADFVWIFDSKYGNCFSFNAGFNSAGNKTELKKMHMPDKTFGLEIELYVNYNENLKLLNRASGAFVQIENSSYSNGPSFKGLFVSPGFEYFLTLDRYFKSTLPQPYSNCQIDNDLPITDFNSDLYKLISHSEFEYSQTMCFLQCYQLYAHKQCSCLDSTIYSFLNYRKCLSQLESNCLNRFFYENFTQNNFIHNYCLPLCPFECNQTEIKVFSSSSQLNGEIYLDMLKEKISLVKDFVERNLDSNRAKESIVKINIFYDSLSYTISTESAKMEVVSLLSNMGGNLGLFLGVSLISLCEIIEALIEICIAFKHNK
jgi:hypothetical protein